MEPRMAGNDRQRPEKTQIEVTSKGDAEKPGERVL